MKKIIFFFAIALISMAVNAQSVSIFKVWKVENEIKITVVYNSTSQYSAISYSRLNLYFGSRMEFSEMKHAQIPTGVSGKYTFTIPFRDLLYISVALEDPKILCADALVESPISSYKF